jgi:hypothetical protein
MARKNITVTRETASGLNTHFHVPGRGEVTRGQLAREVAAGKHPGYHTRDVNGRKIVASNPDSSERNNLG